MIVYVLGFLICYVPSQISKSDFIFRSIFTDQDGLEFQTKFTDYLVCNKDEKRMILKKGAKRVRNELDIV